MLSTDIGAQALAEAVGVPIAPRLQAGHAWGRCPHEAVLCFHGLRTRLGGAPCSATDDPQVPRQEVGRAVVRTRPNTWLPDKTGACLQPLPAHRGSMW